MIIINKHLFFFIKEDIFILIIFVYEISHIAKSLIAQPIPPNVSNKDIHGSNPLTLNYRCIQ